MKIIYSKSEKSRLDKFLHEQLPAYSRTRIQRLIKDGRVTVNDSSVAVHRWLKNGEIIEMREADGELNISAKRPEPEKTRQEPEIIFQDDDIAIIVKPAGVLIHPTEKEETDTLAHWLVKTFPKISDVGDDPERPGIVHRLDKDVGGLVLVALNQESFEYLKSLFQQHTIAKRYHCLVHGVIQGDEGMIDTPVERNKKTGKMVSQTATKTGKEALTTFKVLRRYTQYTLLDVQIITGRTHQIRTHLYSIGHSVVGDPLYQTRDVQKKKKIDILLNKPFLFAYHLSFIDRHGVPREFNSELPDELQKILGKIKQL